MGTFPENCSSQKSMGISSIVKDMSLWSCQSKSLREFVQSVLSESQERKLRVFDFDDTLVKSGSKVIVTHEDGTVEELTPGQYAVYPMPEREEEQEEGDVDEDLWPKFDYSQFELLIDPIAIREITDILRQVVLSRGSAGAMILTARGDSEPVQEFLDLFARQTGIPAISDVNIMALGNPDPMEKARYVSRRIKDDNLTHVEFFDDSIKNVKAVRALQKHYDGRKKPYVNIRSRHVKYSEKY